MNNRMHPIYRSRGESSIHSSRVKILQMVRAQIDQPDVSELRFDMIPNKALITLQCSWAKRMRRYIAHVMVDKPGQGDLIVFDPNALMQRLTLAEEPIFNHLLGF